MIHALVLAAGESKRMGVPKPLLRIGTTTFLGRIVAVLRQSTVDRCTVVLGARADEIQSRTSLDDVDVVFNHDYHRGQLSSLTVGIRSLPPETTAFVLCLVDHPLITSEMVDRIVTAFRETNSPIVVPTCAGRRGHPTLFARPVFQELLDAPSDQGARHVVRADATRVLELELADPAILTRIDTPEDYRAHFGTGPRETA